MKQYLKLHQNVSFTCSNVKVFFRPQNLFIFYFFTSPQLFIPFEFPVLHTNTNILATWATLTQSLRQQLTYLIDYLTKIKLISNYFDSQLISLSHFLG